ncbi:hypothetical protein TNCV_1095211 [Trichonephila clavipes]|nr:hypothetical protein TNCV_1095211 [Trichonephila clavipes]
MVKSTNNNTSVSYDLPAADLLTKKALNLERLIRSRAKLCTSSNVPGDLPRTPQAMKVSGGRPNSRSQGRRRSRPKSIWDGEYPVVVNGAAVLAEREELSGPSLVGSWRPSVRGYSGWYD